MWQALLDVSPAAVTLVLVIGIPLVLTIALDSRRLDERQTEHAFDRGYKNAGFDDPRIHPRWSDPAAGRVPPVTRPAPSNPEDAA